MKFSKETIKEIIQEEIKNIVKEEVGGDVRSDEEAYAMINSIMQDIDAGQLDEAQLKLQSVAVYFDEKLAGGEVSPELVNPLDLDEQMSDECREAAEVLRGCLKGQDKRPQSTATELGIMKEPITPPAGTSLSGIKWVKEGEEGE